MLKKPYIHIYVKIFSSLQNIHTFLQSVLHILYVRGEPGPGAAADSACGTQEERCATWS